MKENIHSLTGMEKSAILLLALPPESVGKIFEKMDEVEVKELTQTMALLGKVDPTVVEGLCLNFSEMLSSTGTVMGSVENTEKLLEKFLPADKVKALMEEIRGPAGRTIWDKLCNVSPEVLANFLKGEYPQTIAVVLSNVKPFHASRVLAQLPNHLSLEVIMRMLRLEGIQRDIILDIERTLKAEFMNTLASASQPNPYERVAEMFNMMDRTTESRFMEAIEQQSMEEANRIRELMFTFDDMVKLDNAGIQNVIKVCDKSKLALALKGANDAIKEAFFRNMSERGGKLMKEEMESMGMVKVKAVEEAQSSIVQSAKELLDKGEIELNIAGETEAMVG